MPVSFVAGVTVEYPVQFSSFQPPDWTAKLWLQRSGTVDAPVGYDGATDGNGFKFTITGAESAALPVGQYDYTVLVTKDGDVKSPPTARGTTYITPNPAIAPTASPAQQMLTALNATILALTSSTEFMSTNFNGQSYTRADINKLYDMRVRLQAEVIREQADINRLRGGPDAGRILTRFAPTGYCGPWALGCGPYAVRQ